MIVTDCGGGTVDVISYQITSLAPFQVIESTVGIGGMCGGAFLNARFEEHDATRLGAWKLSEYQTTKPRSWRIAQDVFEERVKRWFGSTSMTEFEVPLAGMPDDDEAGVEDGCLLLTSAQVSAIFEPVLADVITLVDQQVEALRQGHHSIAVILLVGGFGASAALFKHLKSHYQTELPPPYSARLDAGAANTAITDPDNLSIQVLQPQDGWTACLRGALSRGLDGTIVTARKTRYHYGVKIDQIFDASKHPASSKWYDAFYDGDRARAVMS